MMLHVGDKFGAINRLLHTRRLLPAFLVANLLLLCLSSIPEANAQLSVSVIEAVAAPGYQVERIYGGEVRAGRSSTLGFRHAGEITGLHVAEGDSVAAGDLLAELDAEPLEAQRSQAKAGVDHARASVQVAEAALELAAATARRQQELLAKGHVSVQLFDEVRLDLQAKEAQIAVARAELARAEAALRVAEVDLARSRIHAPYAARIQARHVDEGTMLVPGQAVLRLIEASRREARIGLPVHVATTLVPGKHYPLRSGERRFRGTLLHVLPEVDEQTRTLTALFDLSTDEDLPAAGSVIELLLERDVAEPGFWLPLSALSEAQRGLWSLFVVVNDGKQDIVERRLVEVLHSEGNRVFIRGTLTDGEQVVATGSARIVPGQSVLASATSLAQVAP